MAAGPEALERTPLHDRHVAAGARMVPFAGWEMPVQYAGIKQEHNAVRDRAGVFDVSHMGEIETTGPDAEAFLQRILSNDVTKIAEDGAQYSVLCKEDGGVLDDLFSYRLGDRFLTVTNASNHEKDLAWFRKHAEGFDVELHDRLHDLAMLAVQGPQARNIVTGITDGELPKRFRTATRTVAGVDGVLVCGTGYTGEDGVELIVPAAGATAVWDAVVSRGVAPAGLGARDTLRLEVCFHLYGNDLMEERGPIEAGLGWCCKEDTGFIGADAVRAAREAGPKEKLAPFAITGSGIARQGNPVVGGGEVTSGTMSPSLGYGIGMAYLPTDHAEPGTQIEIDVRGRTRTAEVRDKPLYTKESDYVADASYPDDLKYHAEHDWARVDGDTATLGITWYAQEQLGEVVFFDPPQVGTNVTKDQPYAEIESVKAVSDVVSPLSGEITEVNDGLADSPENVNEDPYGDGWLVKIKLSDATEVDDLMDASTYEGSLS